MLSETTWANIGNENNAVLPIIISKIILDCEEQEMIRSEVLDAEDVEESRIIGESELLLPQGDTREQSSCATSYGAVNDDSSTHHCETIENSGDKDLENSDDEILENSDDGRGTVVRSLLLLLALSLHSVFEGLAIGLQATVTAELRTLVAVAVHKCIIAFMLGLSLRSSELGVWGVVRSNVFFSATSPLGMIVGALLLRDAHGAGMAAASVVLQGIASGTFLYVTLFEVLQKEMCKRTDRLPKMAALVLGYAAVAMLLIYLPE